MVDVARCLFMLLLLLMQILERVAREELDVPVLKTRHMIKVLLIRSIGLVFSEPRIEQKGLTAHKGR